MHGSDLMADFLILGSFDQMKLMGRSRSHWLNQKMRLLGLLGPCHDECLVLSLCQKSKVHCVLLVNWWVAESMLETWTLSRARAALPGYGGIIEDDIELPTLAAELQQVYFVVNVMLYGKSGF